MQPLAADLQAEDMRELAEYYAGLTPPQVQSKPFDPALVERGRKLAVEGLPGAGVPPCITCHSPGTPNPRLDGQHDAYMARQLRLRKIGFGPSTENSALMTPIAQKLSDDDINALSAYFARRPVREAQHPD